MITTRSSCATDVQLRQPQLIDHLRLSDFRRLAAFIQDYSGIKMPASKITMLEGRLRHRVRDTGAASFADYCHMLFEQDGLRRGGASDRRCDHQQDRLLP